MWRAQCEMGRPVPRLFGLEHTHPDCHHSRSQPEHGRGRPSTARERDGGRIASQCNGFWRVRPRVGRRPGAGCGRAPWRRSGCRQIHAATAGSCASREPLAGSLRDRRGIRGTNRSAFASGYEEAIATNIDSATATRSVPRSRISSSRPGIRARRWSSSTRCKR